MAVILPPICRLVVWITLLTGGLNILGISAAGAFGVVYKCVQCTSPGANPSLYVSMDARKDQPDCLSNDPAKLNKFSELCTMAMTQVPASSTACATLFYTGPDGTSVTGVSRYCLNWKNQVNADQAAITNTGADCFIHSDLTNPACVCTTDNCNNLGSILKDSSGKLTGSSVAATVVSAAPSSNPANKPATNTGGAGAPTGGGAVVPSGSGAVVPAGSGAATDNANTGAGGIGQADIAGAGAAGGQTSVNGSASVVGSSASTSRRPVSLLSVVVLFGFALHKVFTR